MGRLYLSGTMKSFQATIKFEMSEEFMQRVPPHRTYINFLIKKVVEHYAVSMETQRAWITLNAEDRDAARKLLAQSPLFPFWILEIDELFVLDGQQYRLPEVHPN